MQRIITGPSLDSDHSFAPYYVRGRGVPQISCPAFMAALLWSSPPCESIAHENKPTAQYGVSVIYWGHENILKLRNRSLRASFIIFIIIIVIILLEGILYKM